MKHILPEERFRKTVGNAFVVLARAEHKGDQHLDIVFGSIDVAEKATKKCV
jgi:hypothetical protein